ncbi:hypothetical protein F4827_000833 [Paraburkholderia bannensis]|uniref:Uncharacterized protein n=1 Tax=Paraburkholderia bannensis TaxID=765414 RepID=A0A7W9WR98_9BURK|nr:MULTISPECIES: hypothetical protein [Paraburkholderia]MBB3256007.1 hypothetical protein [Paraburkholderia sp. WP4_3_2]MBB6101007.1 hypothetical protein [Paraburkholderia bannensis]
MNFIKNKIFVVCVVGFALVVFFTIEKFASGSDERVISMNQNLVKIHPGVEGIYDAKSQGFEVMNHPSGVFSYTKHWDNSGTVKVVHGSRGFEINNVAILTALGDGNFPGRGVDNWDVLFSISSKKEISLEEARDRTMELLEKIRAAGWQRYVETSDPRLLGRQAMIYALAEPGRIYSLDSKYTPTLEEWGKLIDIEPRWNFYADGVFVSLTFSYHASSNPGMGSYLMDVEISTASDAYAAYFSRDSVEKKKNWKEYLSDKLLSVREERVKAEAKLDPHEFTIDTSYQAPPFESPDFSAKAKVDAAH